VFLGHSVAQQKNVSEATAQKIDSEVRRLIDQAYEQARGILTKKKKAFIAIAEGLLEYETLTGDEIQAIIRARSPARDIGDDTPPSRGTAVPTAGPKKGGAGKKGDEPDPGMEPQPQ
jgi:cell division protease FtsH